VYVNRELFTEALSYPGNPNMSATLPRMAGHSHKTPETEVTHHLS